MRSRTSPRAARPLPGPGPGRRPGDLSEHHEAVHSGAGVGSRLEAPPESDHTIGSSQGEQCSQEAGSAVGCAGLGVDTCGDLRSEEHTSELQSLMRISYAVFCLKKKKNTQTNKNKY